MFKYIVYLAVVAAVYAQEPDHPAFHNRPRYHVDILKLDLKNDTLKHVCDGAIVGAHYVITAAHCVYDIAGRELRVRSGSDDAPPLNMPHREERLFHSVNKIMYPKDYVYSPCRHHEHDIAILKVNRAFDLAYDHLFKQVDLPEPSNDFEDYNAVVSGYTDEKLNTIDAVIIANELCSRNSTSIVTRSNLCTILNEVSALKKDDISGSPLVHDNTLVGIMNSQINCANFGASIPCVQQPANLKVYTRVTAYLDFIDNVLSHKASSDIVYKV